MGIPIIGPVLKIVKAAAGILGVDSVKDVFDAISNNKLTPEQKLQLELAIQEHQKELRQLDIEELKTVMSETSLMIQSDDKFVKRARPTGLYVAYACSIAITIALIAAIKIDAAAILTVMGPLYGAQGYYIYNRTREKLNGSA